MSDDFADQVAGVGALAEPGRRVLYLFVASCAEAVSREQAADATGIPLHSAKFHLDRLVREGLLDVEFRRLTGRAGPGAGRPSKLYRRSRRQISVSLPERHYDLAGSVLATAIDRSTTRHVPVEDAVREAASAYGRRIAAAAVEDPTSDRAGSLDATSSGAPSDLRRVARLLARHGYEPRTSDDEICLANCPFDQLATEHTALVCAMNLALIDGVIEGLAVSSLTARLAPQTGYCCVRVTTS